MISRLNIPQIIFICLIVLNTTCNNYVKTFETEDIINDRSELYDNDDILDVDVGISSKDFLLEQRKPEIRKIIKFHHKYPIQNFTSNTELFNVADIEMDINDNNDDDIDNIDEMDKYNSTWDSYEITYVDQLEYVDPTYLNKSQRLSATNAPNLGIVYRWGKWDKWNKCSRICGGGVQTRKRTCIEERPVGTDMEVNEFVPIPNGTRKGCVGIFKRFRICNDKPCDYETENSFRTEQCESYNDAPFRGKYYYWESYYKEDNECELNCKPIGQKYYATLNKTVIDGTPCKRPAVYFTRYYRKRAVCVEGICKVILMSDIQY